MKILLTGASGFLGKNILQVLNYSTEIITLGRNKEAIISCDLSTQIPLLPPVEMVIHAAGKAHIIPKTEAEKEEFYKVNVQGTKNLLSALEDAAALKKMVFISTVAVYGLLEGIDVNEDTPLLATDAYGKTKLTAEALIIDWCTSRGIAYYVLRLPLIAGKNAPGNLGAMVKAIKSGKYFGIGKGCATKSVLWVNDVANLLKNIAGPSGIYNLTDGYNPSFHELENKISKFYNKKNPPSLPLIAVKLLAFTGDLIGAKFPINSSKLKKITSTLTFDDAKARAQLNWAPHQVLNTWEIE